MSENPRISVQKHYDMLVAHQTEGSEMAGEGTAGKTIKQLRLRRRFRSNPVLKVGPGFSDHAGFGALNRSLGGHVRGLASFTVADNDFAGGAEIVVGPYTLIAGLDFEVGAGTAATAANIASAIDNLPGYDGDAAGDDVTVEGKMGPQGNADLFSAKSFGTVTNFTDVVSFSESGTAEPRLEGPEID